MSEKLLHKYYLRLKTEGFVKALLWGLAIGFGVLALFGLLYWIMGWKSAWVCLLIWAAVSACATVSFYQLKFKPTTKSIARRVDDLGLHERILTMTELEGDESYIAQRQRRDALEALATVRAELLTIGVSKPSVITAIVATVFGVVAFLFAEGVFVNFSEINPTPPLSYTVTYLVKNGEGGTIVGQTEQNIKVGENTEAVTAIPDDGWRFLKWTDGGGSPNRADSVYSNITYYAVFVEMEFGEPSFMGDEKPVNPPGNGEGEEDKNNTDPSQDEQEFEQKDPEDEISQMIIDGQTYYGNMYDEAYRDAIEDLFDEKYSGAQKDIANGYFDNIERGEKETEENN